MPDWEKVLKELESMRDYHRFAGNNITADIADDALALLKEQEPVKPIKIIGEFSQIYVCGNCNKPVWYKGQAYCVSCGRKVKWDGIF